MAFVFIIATALIVHAEETFFWSMEADIPDTYPTGSDPTVMGGFERTNEYSYSGQYSLDFSGEAYRCAMFNNPTSEHVWAGLTEGTIRLYFRYSSKPNFMLFQITGKDITKQDDTNDAIMCSYKANSNHWIIMYYYNGGYENMMLKLDDDTQPNSWCEMVLKWRLDQAPYFSLSINGKEATYSNPIGIPACNAWHHLLIGNDTQNVPDGFWLDDFEVHNKWIDTLSGNRLNAINPEAINYKTEKTKKKFEIAYPNPMINKINITNYGGSMASKFTIFNEIGQAVYESKRTMKNENMLEWDGTTNGGCSAPAGTYFYILNNGKAGKFVKQ